MYNDIIIIMTLQGQISGARGRGGLLYPFVLTCDTYTHIIVEDAERDTIRCRWAELEQDECAGVCRAFPNAVLDMV